MHAGHPTALGLDEDEELVAVVDSVGLENWSRWESWEFM
jgi:hypothetical protein